MKLRFLWIVLAVVALAAPARAELQIVVSGAMRDPMPIAFPEMIHDGFFVGQYGDKIRNVVIADLERYQIHPIISKTFAINNLQAAFAYHASQQHLGKIVLNHPVAAQ